MRLSCYAMTYRTANGQRVTQRQLRGGTGGGRQIEGAGFFLDAAVQHHVGMARQRGARAARHRHQGHIQPLDQRQQHGKLVHLPAVGNGQHRVTRADHAQVAVAGFGRMHEERRRAGGCQRGRDLAAHVAALAHAHHDDAPVHLQQQAHGAHERIAHPALQAQHGRGLDVQRLVGQAQHLGGIKRHAGILSGRVRRGARCGGHPAGPLAGPTPAHGLVTGQKSHKSASDSRCFV